MRKILIVVDMQNDFVTGSLGSKDAQAILEPVKKKIMQYEKDGNEIIFTRDTHDAEYMDTNEGKHLPVPHCICGTEGWQICKTLTEGMEKPITCIDKPTFGYMDWKQTIQGDTEDGSGLRIELIGVCTDICVVSNALILKAMYPEADIFVDANCCAGVTKKAHEAALLTMESCQIQVLR